jgi:lantibiotic biosynthesis protein
MMQNLDICRDIGNKLKNPESAFEILNKQPGISPYFQENWPSVSLEDGFAGIALYYGVLDEVLPGEGWDVIAHSYLKQCVEIIENKGFQGISLLYGLTGVCYSTYICSKNGTRYQTLLNKLDKLLIHELETSFLINFNAHLGKSEGISPELYNYASGLSGILTYLIMRKEDPEFRRLATDCLYSLVHVLNEKKVIDGKELPAWVISPKHQYGAIDNQGVFSLSVYDGVLGCLSILSLAACEGLVVSGQYEMIDKMVAWVKLHKRDTSLGASWPYIVSVAPLKAEDLSEDQLRDIWNYGTPAVSTSLYLAGKATKNRALIQFAEETFLSVFSRGWRDWEMMGTCFISGRAGLLASTIHMHKHTLHPSLPSQVQFLTKELIRFYSPEHSFGFKSIHIDDLTELHWVDKIGLMEGVLGIALALLLENADKNNKWQNLFLLI